MKAVLLFTALVIGVVGVISIGARRAWAHGGAAVAVTPTAAMPGSSITITVEGYEASTPASVTLEGVNGSTPIGTFTTDANGSGSLTATLPASLKAGTYSVKAVGGDDNESAELSVTVAANATSTGATAQTGGAVTYKQPTAQWVGIAVAAGIVALFGFALVLRRDNGSAAPRRR